MVSGYDLPFVLGFFLFVCSDIVRSRFFSRYKFDATCFTSFWLRLLIYVTPNVLVIGLRSCLLCKCLFFHF